jgi:predicted nucleotide-binding protein (sugar kinase/HSP70/actin superfamily)
MKKTAITLAFLAVLPMTCAEAHAQKTGSKTPTVTSAPDLSKLNIDKVLQQLQTTTLQPSSDETSPLQVVAEFLQLSTGQVTELEQLLQARQATLVPLFQTAQALIQQVGNLLNSGANPAQIGAVVIQIHALQQQTAQTQQAFLTQFMAILDAQQLQKLQAVQVAVQLQPILSAFQPIFLF